MFFVRTAMEKDLPRVAEILHSSFHFAYDAQLGSDKVDEICRELLTVDDLAAKRDQPNTEFLVADNGEVVGGMAHAEQIGKEIMLHMLYVDPQYHGGKTGLHLLIEAENSFMDADTICLEVHPENDQAIRFYEKYGFRKTGEERADCGRMKGVSAIVMEKAVNYAED